MRKRKQPKYLHDVPPEALRRDIGPKYNQVSNTLCNSSNNNGPATPSIASELNPRLEGQQSLFSRQPMIQWVPVPQVSKDAFEGGLFDPGSPAQFNFDLEGLNFGSSVSIYSQGMGDVDFYNVAQDMILDFEVDHQHSVSRRVVASNIHQGSPHAYTINASLPIHYSPNTDVH